FGSFSMANWLPDGKRVLFSAMEQGQGSRLYLMDIESERVRRLTPEGVRLFSVKAISPDGAWFFADRGQEGWAIYSTEGGPDSKPRPIRGLAEGDGPIGWTADGGSLFVQDIQENPAGVYRVDLT